MTRSEQTFRILAAASVHEGRISREFEAILAWFADALELEARPILDEAERGLKISDLLPHREGKRRTLYAYIVETACRPGDPTPDVQDFVRHLAPFFEIPRDEVDPLLAAEIERGRERRRRIEAKSARDLRMEAHLRSVGFWLQLGPVLLVAGSAVERLWIALAVFAASGLLLVVLGHRLMRYSDGARVVSAIFAIAALGALLVQGLTGVTGVVRALNWISIAATTLILIALLHPRAAEVCSPSYRERVERTPHLKPTMPGSPLFWVPIAIFLIQAAIVWLGR